MQDARCEMHDATDLVQVLVRLLERLSFRCNVAVVERVVPTSTDVVKGGRHTSRVWPLREPKCSAVPLLTDRTCAPELIAMW